MIALAVIACCLVVFAILMALAHRYERREILRAEKWGGSE